jgi:Fanconi anemia group M protein
MIVLVAKGTRDEGYRWSAHHKEQRMYRNLDKLKNSVEYNGFSKYKKDEASENPFTKFEKPKDNVKMYVDDREKGSAVVKELVDLDCDLDITRMESADYVLSARVGVEYKTVPDFVDSIIDGRLLDQLKGLKEFFPRPLVIVQGEEDIFSVRRIHPNAINGMLATITVSYGIPILYTRNHRETAMLLTTIASREQNEVGKDFNPHREKRGVTLKEQQEYIVSSFPGIGGTLSKPLLEKFGSVKKIVDASIDELKEIEQIGKIKAEKLREVFDKEYEKK